MDLDDRKRYLDATLPHGWDDPEHLEGMHTLSTAQADDLKIDDGLLRVWLSRVTDGGVTVEEIRRGKWRTYWSNHEEVDPS